MNSTPPDEMKNNPSQSSGNIYTQPEHSSYENASSLPTPGNDIQAPVAGSVENVPENPPPGAISEPPPMYSSSPFKKILILISVLLIFLGLAFLLYKVITKKGTSKNTNVPVKLTYWGLWETNAVMGPLIEEYQKTHKNITIEYTQQSPQDYRERLQSGINRGDGPDIFRFHNTWTPMLKDYLASVPANIYSDEDFKKIFYPVVRESVHLGDSNYGIPLGIDGLMLLYNKDILDGANVTVPQTWFDVQNATSKLTVKEQDKIITSAIALGTAENVEHFSDILGLMILQNGTQPHQSLFSCNKKDSTDCSTQALKFYRSFAQAPGNTWDETLDNSIVAFADGKVAMIFAPSWQIANIKSINPNLNFKTAVVPQLPCSDNCVSVNWASFWLEGVSNKSKNEAEAFAFLKFLSQKETLEKFFELSAKQNQLFGEAYPRTDMASLLADNTYLAPLMSEAPSMKSFYLASRTYDGDTGLNTSLISYLKNGVNSLSQGVSEESALKTIDAGFKEVLARFGISAVLDPPLAQ